MTQVINYIIITTTDLLGIHYDDIDKECRQREIVYARYISYALCKRYTNLTNQGIGELFRGKYNHCTVTHGLKAVNDAIHLFNHKNVRTDMGELFRYADQGMRDAGFKVRWRSMIDDIL